MADQYSRMRQLVGTTGEWAQNDLVLGAGEVAVEFIDPTNANIKIGNGVARFSQLPYMTANSSGGGASGVTSFNGRSGPVTLNGADVGTAIAQTDGNDWQWPSASQKQSIYMKRTGQFTGGPFGHVFSAIYAEDYTPTGTHNSFEWCITGVMHSRSVTSGTPGSGVAPQNVAVNGTAFKEAGNAPVWGGNFVAYDVIPGAYTGSRGPLIGVEVNVGLEGLDSGENTIGVDVVCQATKGSSNAAAWAGIRVDGSANTNFSSGIVMKGGFQRGYQDVGTHLVGIDLSGGTFTNAQLRLKSDAWVSLDGTDTYRLKFNPNSKLLEFYGGAARRGFINLDSGADVDLAAGGGGGGGGTPGPLPTTKTLGDFVLSNTSAEPRMVFADTNPGTWNVGAGSMTVQFDVVPNNYFTANPNGHFAVVLRQDAALATTDPTGQGIAVGNATGYPGGGSDLNPTPLLETFAKGTLPVTGLDNFLWSHSESARSAPMVDGQTYRFIVESSVDVHGERWLRYRMWVKNAGTGAWDIRVDTGHVLDHNTTFEATQTGLMFGHVFAGAGAWSLNFSNVKVSWGPLYVTTADTTAKLSRFGGLMDGDLRFGGFTSRSIDSNGTLTFKSNGTPVWSYNASGLTLPGATKQLGQPVDSFTFFSGIGGGQAKAWTDGTTFHLENVCADGNIRTYFSATPQPVELEIAIRPLYCILSTLMGELKAKKVI